MRIFVILLILANLGYAAWNISMSAEEEPVMVRAPSRQAERSLQLLSEIEVPAAPPIIEAQTCISLGVFENTAESDFLVSALLERGFQASVELLPSESLENYRVYMPPFNSDTAARQTLSELQASEIESFIISTGEFSGGISLGLFSQQDLALALQESLAAQGFPSSIQLIATANNEIWVTIEGLSQDLLEGSELLNLLSNGLDLQVIEKPCETFASSQ